MALAVATIHALFSVLVGSRFDFVLDEGIYVDAVQRIWRGTLGNLQD